MVHVHEVRAEFDKQNQVYVITIFSWINHIPKTYFLFIIYDLNIIFSHASLEEELAFLKQADQFSDRQSILTGNNRYSR